MSWHKNFHSTMWMPLSGTDDWTPRTFLISFFHLGYEAPIFFWNSILNCTLFLSEVRKLFNMFWSLWHDHHEWLALKYIFIWNEFHIKLENSYIDNSRNCFVNNRKNSKLITLFIEVNECNLNVFIQRGAAKRATKKKSLVADNEEPVSKINYLNQL